MPKEPKCKSMPPEKERGRHSLWRPTTTRRMTKVRAEPAMPQDLRQERESPATPSQTPERASGRIPDAEQNPHLTVGLPQSVSASAVRPGQCLRFEWSRI